jgi:8-oxo-dGTP diphosphatase
MPATIRAAGGLIWRGSPGAPEVAVIHRPHRGDWSLPKGKLCPGEAAATAACREVVEETGLTVALQHRLGTVRYRVNGAPKQVEYWAMGYRGGEFAANDEADRLRWVTLRDANKLLDFPTDRTILAAFGRRRPPDTAVLLIRHAKAGKRSAWKKDDELRPLDADGRRQAQAIAAFGSLFAPDEICAATPLRCRQTVEPLAEKLDLPVNAAPALSDRDFTHDPRRSARALRALARTKWVVVASSQGDAIPGLLASVDPDHAPFTSRKGSVWALFFAHGQLVQADYYERPKA